MRFFEDVKRPALGGSSPVAYLGDEDAINVVTTVVRKAGEDGFAR